LEFRSPIPLDDPSAAASGPYTSPLPEDPVWSFFDVVLIAAFGFVVQAVFLISAIQIAHSSGRFRGMRLSDLEKWTVLLVPVQVASYLMLIAFMVALLKLKYGVDNFLEAVRWNAPDLRTGLLAVVGGMGLGFFSAISSTLLDRWIPKSLPIHEYFRDASSAYTLAFLGIFVAPFVEELFFRGFLYPALARKLGVAAAIIFTAAPFALLHEQQLAHAWIPLLLLFVIGSILTFFRAKTKSLAIPVLMHAGYNSTLFVLLFIGTQGFRHMERV